MAGLTYANAIIHPRCPIDENAMIGRSCVWPIPPKPPISALVMAINKGAEGVVHFMAVDNTPKGASFCQVVKINRLFQFKEEATGGNQKWKGAAPSFINTLAIISAELKLEG